MRRITVFKVFVSDQEEARRFYVDQLGFEVAEDRRLGDYRWLLVRAPDNTECAINLEIARTSAERALVGQQGAGTPIFGIATDDCMRDYQELRKRGVTFDGEPKTMPYGTGVMLQDMAGNRIYLNQDMND
jgi:catechol 2,3-dioxygenase-like lactoylglutathione lyase family enzyme